MSPADGAVRAAWRAVRRAKRLVCLVALTDALVFLPAALYVAVTVHRAAGHRVDASSLARVLDPDLLADMDAGSGDFRIHQTVLAAACLVLFFALRPLVMGGYVAIAARGDRIRFDEFVRVGGAVYWKFLRIALVGVVTCYLLSLAAKPLLAYIDDQASSYVTEGPAITYRRATEVFVFTAYWVLGTILDYTRVGVRMYRRPGVFVELGRSALFVLQHPVETLGFSAFAFAIELAAIWGFSELLQRADGAYVLTSLSVLLLAQVLVALREATRLFHHAGAWRIRRRAEGAAHDDPSRRRPSGDDLLENLPWNQ